MLNTLIMLIDCPACARSYHVSRADIGDAGRAVICPRCEASWFVDADGTSVDVPTEGPSDADLRVTAFSGRPAAMAPDTPARPVPGRAFAWAPAGAALVCLALAMGGLGAREKIVRAAPRLAGLYAAMGLPVNVRGLEIEALLPARPEAAPSDIMVAGTIRNVAQRRVAVPRLAYEVRDAAGAPLLTWTEAAPAHALSSGRTLPFVSSPHALPPGARSVLVRFEDADPTPSVHLARADR